MSNKVYYQDYVGFKFFKIHDWMLRGIGIHKESDLNDESGLRRYKKYFGLFMITLVCLQGWSVTIATFDSVKNEDLASVTTVIAYLSVTFSTLSKYQIAVSHSTVMYKLGMWMKEVRSKRPEDKQISTLEGITMKANMAFYCMAVTIQIIWTFSPIFRNGKAFIPTQYPFMDIATSNVISFPWVQVPLYLFMSAVVSYTATALLHFIAVFCTEVRLLSKRWSLVIYDRKNPAQYMERMRACVDDHSKLMEVMKDINVLHDSLFAFQVFIFIAHFVAFNYAFLVTSGGSAMATLFPMTSISILEFALLCWTGEEISHSLQEFHTSIYMTNWYEAPVPERKCMIIALEMLKKRQVLTGAKVFNASLDTFVDGSCTFLSKIDYYNQALCTFLIKIMDHVIQAKAARQSFSLYTLMKALVAGE